MASFASDLALASNRKALSKLNAKAKDTAAKESKAAADGAPVMTPERIKLACLEHDGYETPELNDKLYLHFVGFRKIENLHPYFNLKALWLENNGIRKIECVGHLHELRSLYLQNNLISNIENLEGLQKLVTLDLSGNLISSVEKLSALGSLNSLNLAKNVLSNAEAVAHLQECATLTTLDLSDNMLPADEADSVVTTLTAVPKLTTLYLKGNPVVRDTRHYRKAVISKMPGLMYLDEKPVFEVERVSTDAWSKGGREAEVAARKSYEDSVRAKDKSSMERFQKWKEEVREKRAAELAAHNAALAAEGKPPVSEVPRKAYVSYGRVSKKYADEHIRLKELMEKAEAVARKNGFSGPGIQELGLEYWKETAALSGAAKPLKEGGVSSILSQLEAQQAAHEAAGTGQEHTITPAYVDESGKVVYVDEHGMPIQEGEEGRDKDVLLPSIKLQQAEKQVQEEEEEEEEEKYEYRAGGVSESKESHKEEDRKSNKSKAKKAADSSSDSEEDEEEEEDEETKKAKEEKEKQRKEQQVTLEAVQESLRLFNERAKQQEEQLASAAEKRKEEMQIGVAAITAAVAAAAAPVDGEATTSAAAAAGSLSSSSADSSNIVWTAPLDAALRKLTSQAAFDFEKVSKAMRVAMNKGLLPLPVSKGFMVGGSGSDLMTAEACRKRYTQIAATPVTYAAAVPAVQPAAAAPVPVNATVQSSSAATAGGVIAPPPLPLSPQAAHKTKKTAVAAEQEEEEDEEDALRRKQQAEAPVLITAASPAKDLFPTTTSSKAKSSKAQPTSSKDKTLSDLVMGDFSLRGFREYVKAPPVLPSMHADSDSEASAGKSAAERRAAVAMGVAAAGEQEEEKAAEKASNARAAVAAVEQQEEGWRAERAAAKAGSNPASTAASAAKAEGVAASTSVAPATAASHEGEADDEDDEELLRPLSRAELLMGLAAQDKAKAQAAQALLQAATAEEEESEEGKAAGTAPARAAVGGAGGGKAPRPQASSSSSAPKSEADLEKDWFAELAAADAAVKASWDAAAEGSSLSSSSKRAAGGAGAAGGAAAAGGAGATDTDVNELD